MNRKLIIASLILLSMSVSPAWGRIIRSINDGWLFCKDGVKEVVNIPHCINAHDTWDEAPGYWRGKCSYTKSVRINDNLDSKKVYLRFEGVGQVCEPVVNGVAVGRHVGAYTACVFDITSAVRQGDNVIVVNVDNSFNPDITPLDADFTFYGGIYRDVNLVITEADHICNTFYASSGVFLTTPVVGETSTVQAKTMLDVSAGKYILKQSVYAPDGGLVASSGKALRVKSDSDKTVVQTLEVSNCKLWDIDRPNTYRVVTTLCDSKGKEIDSVENPLGFRTYSFDAQKGFVLNGRHVKIMGTNRHQDYMDRGNALTDAMHLRDVMLLKNMGGNFLRIAHYPQDPVVTQICDRCGIMCSVEIPIINYVTESNGYKDCCIEMAREMVCQDYNSPSVLIWAYMNEVLLHVPYKENQPELRKHYFESVCDIAHGIEAAIRELDPCRPTMIPCDAHPAVYAESGLGYIPDILGWNHYQGWYSAQFRDFETRVLKEHETFPDKPLIVTEFGAGVDPRLHSKAPVRFDFSMEYGMSFHKHYIESILNTPWIAGGTVWNLNDFYCESRVDAVPHVNSKGLVGLDRVPKDSYYLYQAYLQSGPFLAIGGRNWTLRGGVEGESFPVEVYTNVSAVTLYLNGTQVNTVSAVNHVASFEIVPVKGENILVAKATGGLEDAVRFQYDAVPGDMKDFVRMNVSLGSDCHFEDAVDGVAWIPEKEYGPGTWGYIGGERYRLKTSKGFLPGTNKDILGTVNNPIFQTQREGIKSFRADVPDGKYYVYLYFAELTSDESVAFNASSLGNVALENKAVDRIFNVSINGVCVLNEYNIRAEEGACRAVIRKFEIDVRSGSGLSIDFMGIVGEPVLNAITIYRCY